MNKLEEVTRKAYLDAIKELKEKSDCVYLLTKEFSKFPEVFISKSGNNTKFVTISLSSVNPIAFSAIEVESVDDETITLITNVTRKDIFDLGIEEYDLLSTAKYCSNFYNKTESEFKKSLEEIKKFRLENPDAEFLQF